MPPEATTVETGEDVEEALLAVLEDTLVVAGFIGADEDVLTLVETITGDEVDFTELVESVGLVGAIEKLLVGEVIAVVVGTIDATGEEVPIEAVVGAMVPAVFSKQLHALVIRAWYCTKTLGTGAPGDAWSLGQKDAASEAKRSRALKVLSS